MNRRLALVNIALLALAAGIAGAGVTPSGADELTRVEVGVGELRGEILSLFAPQGAIATETNPNYKGAAAPAVAPPPSPAAAGLAELQQDADLGALLRPRPDQHQERRQAQGVVHLRHQAIARAFETGLIMVEGALIGTTEFDIFSIDPATCAENWRTHEEYPGYLLPTNRGAAYMDGMLYRGTEDGRVLAYDFKTGKRVWETTIGGREEGRDRAGGADRLERPRLRRQRRRRLKGRRRGACTRSTARRARSFGNSISCPRSRAMWPAVRRERRPLTLRPGRTSPGLPISGARNLDFVNLGPR